MDGVVSAELGERYTSLNRDRNDDNLTEDEYSQFRERYLQAHTGPVYTFDTEVDIVRIIDRLTAEAKDTNIFPVLHVYDPRRMIQLGLYPTLRIGYKVWIFQRYNFGVMPLM